MESLNKEFEFTNETLDTLIEEMTDREEMACKGDVTGITVCGVN